MANLNMLLTAVFILYTFPPTYSLLILIYMMQQIQCLYLNESINQFVLGYYVNDPNKVGPVGTHKHEYININHDTKISQSVVAENHPIKAKNDGTNNQRQQPPPPINNAANSSTIKTKRKKRKKQKKGNINATLYTTVFPNKTESVMKIEGINL